MYDYNDEASARIANAVLYAERLASEQQQAADWNDYIAHEWNRVTTERPDLDPERFSAVAGEVLNAGGNFDQALAHYDATAPPKRYTSLDEAADDMMAEDRARRARLG